MQFNTQFINMEQRNSQEKLNSHQQDQQPPPPPRRMKPPENQMAVQHQPPPPQKCPRCDSSNTKFCYYNNYSLSQPRYFCKGCRRYWTHGGTLRNVPVGGGCRKTKRSKPSPSTSNEIVRTQNFTGMVPGHGLRGLAPPVIPSIGNSFYTTGSFMSPLAAIQSLPAGINQGAAGSGGNGQFGANMALLQGMNLPSVRPHQQFQAQNDHFFRSQQNLMAQRPALNSWTQSFINRTTATTSAGSPTFWGGATACNAADGENQTGSTSFNPNQWSHNNNNNPGFGPSQ